MTENRRGQPEPVNDPLLEPLLEAADEPSANAVIGSLIVSVATPLMESIVARYRHGERALQPHDTADIIAGVTLNLVTRLRLVQTSADHAIQQFRDYVARVTYNAVNEHLRQRYPERTRLKQQLRYLLTRDPRLALWPGDSGLVAGAARFHGLPTAGTITLPSSRVTPAMLNRRQPAEALHAIVSTLDTPVVFEQLIDFVAELWGVIDVAAGDIDAASHALVDEPLSRMVNQELLRSLWREVQELRPMQRAALLLNLRAEEASMNLLSLLVIIGTATPDEIAGAVGVTGAELGALLQELPFDDNRIAAILGVSRQQVINLRRAARRRLARRLGRSAE